MKRRRIRKYKVGKRNSGVKFLWIVGIIIGAIIAGYLTTRFIIGPMLGYDTEVLKLELPSKISDVFSFESSGKENNGDDQIKYKFALQYGIFSERTRADNLVMELKNNDVDAEVIEIDGKYKVISNKCATKDEALNNLKNSQIISNYSVFVTGL